MYPSAVQTNYSHIKEAPFAKWYILLRCLKQVRMCIFLILLFSPAAKSNAPSFPHSVATFVCQRILKPSRGRLQGHLCAANVSQEQNTVTSFAFLW